MTRRALIIFLKNPEPGKVKTRLCGRFSPEQAAALYKAMAEDVILANKGDGSYDALVFYSPPEAGDAMRAWLGSEHRIISQEGQSLGDRQYNAFRAAYGMGYGQVVIIGTDCLEITSVDVGEAFRLLEHTGLVIGPSEDGGYYLIAASRVPDFLRDDIAWSTSRVLDQLLERAARAGVKCKLLMRRSDIDTCDDVDRLYEGLTSGAGRARAPRTLEVLRTLMGDGE